MTADLVERLEIAAKIHDDMTGKGNAMAATIREAASALRSSGEAVAWLITWNDGSQKASLDPCHPDDGSCRPLYLHPATVTDEDVERSCECSWPTEALFSAGANTEWANADVLRRGLFKCVIRIALESFVRITPPASTKGG